MQSFGGEPVATATAPTQTSTTPLGCHQVDKDTPPSLATLLDGQSYPHITDRIIFLLGRDAIPFRALSRNICTAIDRSLLFHICQTQCGIVDTNGKLLPRTDHARYQELKGAPRIISLAGDCNPGMSLAEQPEQVDMSRARVLRMSCAATVLSVATPTFVSFANTVPSYPDDWFIARELYMPVLEESVHRVVYNISYTCPLLLLSSNINWGARPQSGREWVVRFESIGPPPPRPRYVIGKSGNEQVPLVFEFMPANRVVPWGFDAIPVPPFVRDLGGIDYAKMNLLDQLATLFSEQVRPGVKFTIVGLEAIEAPPITSIWTRRHTAFPPPSPQWFRHVMEVGHQRKNGLMVEVARNEVDSAIEFLTEDQYRRKIGEDQWGIEASEGWGWGF